MADRWDTEEVAIMIKKPKGEWVLFEDYQQLEKRDTIMVEALSEIKAKIEGNPEQPQSIAELINSCIEELASIQST